MYWDYYYCNTNWKGPLVRKKERKKTLQAEVRHRRYVKWLKQEPSRWRIIAWIRWRMSEPKGC